MSSTTDAPDAPVIPADAGLPARGQSAGAPGERRDLISASAEGEALSEQESNDLLAYYLTNDGLPGDEDITPLTVTLGHGAAAKPFRCEVHSIEWAEWQDARERATDSQTGEFDTYISASWVVARALVTPKLGPIVAQKQAEDPDKAPTDAAALLRRMFRRQSGALLELSGKVLEISKLANDGTGAVKEVEAAKN